DDKAALLAVQKRVRDRYNEVRDAPAYDLGRVKAELATMNGAHNAPTDIAISVLRRLRQKRRATTEMDFSDYEHDALQILSAGDGAIGERYRRQFKEIMIDEYQDINRVQEAIIQALKTGGESDGNLFMVGDVKQSIYKFRQDRKSTRLNSSHVS